MVPLKVSSAVRRRHQGWPAPGRRPSGRRDRSASPTASRAGPPGRPRAARRSGRWSPGPSPEPRPRCRSRRPGSAGRRRGSRRRPWRRRSPRRCRAAPARPGRPRSAAERRAARDPRQQPAELALLALVVPSSRSLTRGRASMAVRCRANSCLMPADARSTIWFICARSKALCSAVPCTSTKRSSSVMTTLKSTSAVESSA